MFNQSSPKVERRRILTEIGDKCLLAMFWKLAIQRRRRIGWTAAATPLGGLKLQKLEGRIRID